MSLKYQRDWPIDWERGKLETTVPKRRNNKIFFSSYLFGIPFRHRERGKFTCYYCTNLCGSIQSCQAVQLVACLQAFNFPRGFACLRAIIMCACWPKTPRGFQKFQSAGSTQEEDILRSCRKPMLCFNKELQFKHSFSFPMTCPLFIFVKEWPPFLCNFFSVSLYIRTKFLKKEEK